MSKDDVPGEPTVPSPPAPPIKATKKKVAKKRVAKKRALKKAPLTAEEEIHTGVLETPAEIDDRIIGPGSNMTTDELAQKLQMEGVDKFRTS